MKWTWLRAGSLASVCLAVGLLGVLMAYGTTSEVPIGSLEGTVTMSPSLKPLPNAEVVLMQQFDLPEDAPNSWSTRTGADGKFQVRNLPAGLYSVNAYGKAHSNSQSVFAAVVEGKTESVMVRADRSGEDLSLNVSQRVFLPEESPSLTMSGFADDGDVKLEVYFVQLASILEKKNPSIFVNALTNNRTAWDPKTTPGLIRVKEERVALAQKDVEGYFVQETRLPPLGPGQYLVRTSVGKTAKYAWISVSRIALVTKSSGRDVLAFVTDLKTGAPLEGAQISYAVSDTLNSVIRTSKDGTARFQMPDAPADTRLVLAQQGGSHAYTLFYGGSGNQSQTALYVQTDRPVYRPGDTVKYKVVARDRSNDMYKVSKGNLNITVYDPDESPLMSTTLGLDGFGTASAEFKTDPTALPGPFRIEVKHGESTESYFVSVVSYRKPAFRVSVAPEKPTVVRGERARFKVHAETYTGEPAADMDVTINVYRREDWSFDPFYEGSVDDEEDYLGTYGDFVRDVKGRTDAQGDFSFDQSVEPVQGQDPTTANAVVMVDAVIEDGAGRSASGSGSVRVLRGELDLQATPSGYIVAPGTPVEFRVQAKSVAGSATVAGLGVEVVYGHERWTGNDVAQIVDGSQTVTLDDSGNGVVRVEAKDGGTLFVRFKARDARGNLVVQESTVWVQTGQTDFGGPSPDLQLILDKPTYAPGATAKALIRTGSPGGTALVTVEANGVLWSRTVALSETSTLVDLEALGDYAPNAVVSASYVHDKRYFVADRTFKVDLTEKTLTVDVKPDKATAKPGDLVTYDISTKHLDGRPVPADVALGVVDESVFAIRKDTNDPLKFFYPRRWSSVETAYSFPELYLDGDDKSPRAVKVRRRFEDTAAWYPSVRTDQRGQARVSVRLPDNLTEWRATATAFSMDTKVGKSTAAVVIKQDLMVRLSLPSFMVEQDSQRVAARVSNTTSQPMTVAVQATAAGGAILGGEESRRVTVGAGQTVELSWPSVARHMGTATFRVIARQVAGPASDAVEQSLPVYVHGRRDTASTVGETTTAARWEFRRDESAIDGRLSVTLTPTRLTSLIPVLPSLVDYPYGCAEQTTSRFVPAVLVVKLMRQLGISNPLLEARIPEITRLSLARLRELQSSEGGWGWWEYDQPDTWMTAYVLEGLSRVKQAGVQVDPRLTDRGLDWAETFLKNPQAALGEDGLYLASSVLRHRDSEAARTVLTRKVDLRVETPFLLAQRVLALYRAGNAAYREALVELQRRAELTRDTAHWPAKYGDEATGAAIEALAVADPQNPLIEKAVRYVAGTRKGSSWQSTRDTARVVMALSARFATGQIDQGGTAEIWVNGGPVRRNIRLGVKSAPLVVSVPNSALKAGDNLLEVRSTGGKVYYSAQWDQDLRTATYPPAKRMTDAEFSASFHAVSTARLEDGSVRQVSSGPPVTTARSGDVLRLRLTLTARRDVSQFIAEVPIPSNMRIVDEDQPFENSYWDWWYSKCVFTDEKAVVFGSLEAGTRTIDIAVRAEAPGVCWSRPGAFYRMYQPDDMATTSSLKMEVRPK